MTNPFYTPDGNPAAATRGASSVQRAEFALIQAGFDVVKDVVASSITGAANYAVDSGAVNAYVLSNVGTIDGTGYITAYTDGLMVRASTANANTGASVINVNALGNKSILRRDGSPLQAGDILATSPFTIIYSSSAGAFYLTQGVAGTPGTNGTSGLEPYEERANTTIPIGNGDASKKIKITGTGNSTQAFDAYTTLTAGWRTRLLNGTTGYIQVTSDNATYRMYQGEEREFYVDKVNGLIKSTVVRPFRFSDQSAGTFVVPPSGCGYDEIVVRVTGSGAGGGGGGGGGSGRSGATTAGGSGGSGGAAGQSGASVVRRIPLSQLPAAGTSISYAPGAAGTKGAKGTGGAGRTAGAGSGNSGTNGTNGSVGNPTTFGTSTDLHYVTVAGGATGNNAGLAGTGSSGAGGLPGGAAVTNSASTTAASLLSPSGSIQTATFNGTVSVAGSNNGGAIAGSAGGASGDTSVGIALAVARSGASLAPGGVAQAVVGSAGNNGTTPAAETSAGVGGLGGGGGSGSAGDAALATGKGGDGGDGANGGPGEIEIWAE